MVERDEVERPRQDTRIARIVGGAENISSLVHHKLAPKFEAFGTGLRPERMVELSAIALRKNPDLEKCTTESFGWALIDSVRTGLEPDGVHAAIVHRRDKNAIDPRTGRGGALVAQFMPMYQGIVAKLLQEGVCTGVESRVAYESEEFDVQYGTESMIFHRPNLVSARGKAVAVYAVFHLPGGHSHFEVMTVSDVEEVRREAKTQKVWGKWWGEMARKTVVRRGAKMLPRKPLSLVEVIEVDNRAHSGHPSLSRAIEEGLPDDAIVDAEFAEMELEPPASADPDLRPGSYAQLKAKAEEVAAEGSEAWQTWWGEAPAEVHQMLQPIFAHLNQKAAEADWKDDPAAKELIPADEAEKKQVFQDEV